MSAPLPTAICGHCGLPFSNHHDEPTGIYCFENTTGDTWTDDPDAEAIGNMIESNHPELWEQFITEWKQKNGHLPPVKESMTVQKL